MQALKMVKTVKYLLPNVLAISMQFVAAGIITNNTSPEMFGKWSYTYGLFTIICTFVLFGSGGLVLREFSRSGDVERHKAVINHALIAGTIVTLVIFPIIFIHFSNLTKVLIDSPLMLAIIISLASFFLGAGTVVSSFFLSQKKQLLSTIFFYIPKPLALMMASLMTFYVASLSYMWFAFFFGLILLLVIYYKQCLLLIKFVSGKFILSSSYLKQGVVIMLIYSHIQINTYIDSYFLLHYSDTEDVGFYRLAFMLSGLGLFISGSVVRQMSPYIGDFLGKSISSKEFYRLLKRHNYWATTLAVCILLFFVFFGRIGIGLLFGEAYLVVFYPLIIMTAGYAIKFLLGPGEIVLNLSFNDNILLFVTISGITFNVLLDWLLIREYGVLGCAWSTVLTTCLMAIIIARLAFVKTNINTTIFNLGK